MGTTPNTTMNDTAIPSNVSQHDAWTFHCDECGISFMQSFEFHNEEYHDGRLTQ